MKLTVGSLMLDSSISRNLKRKTDRRDAANLSLALWMASRSREMKLPEVWQPGPVVRELRRCFGMYELKNEIHGVLLDNGIRDRVLGTRMADSPKKAEATEFLVEVLQHLPDAAPPSLDPASLN